MEARLAAVFVREIDAFRIDAHDAVRTAARHRAAQLFVAQQRVIVMRERGDETGFRFWRRGEIDAVARRPHRVAVKAKSQFLRGQFYVYAREVLARFAPLELAYDTP